MNIGSVPIGNVVLIEWNRESVQVIGQSFTRTIVRSLAGNGTREVSPGCPVLPFVEDKQSGTVCACGCGQIVVGQRSTLIYATTTCRKRLFKRNGKGDGKTGHSRVPGDANSGS